MSIEETNRYFSSRPKCMLKMTLNRSSNCLAVYGYCVQGAHIPRTQASERE